VTYTVYTDGSKKRDCRPVISLRPSAAIRLNIIAMRLLAKDGVERVRVLWDAQKRKIALAAANDDPNAYKVYVSKARNQAHIGAKSFAGFIGLSPGATVKVYASYSNKMLEATVPKEAFDTDVGRVKKRVVNLDRDAAKGDK